MLPSLWNRLRNKGVIFSCESEVLLGCLVGVVIL